MNPTTPGWREHHAEAAARLAPAPAESKADWEARTQGRPGRRARRAMQAAADAALQKRTARLLPNAREIHAVRIVRHEQRTDKHGRPYPVLVTLPWPPGFTMDDLLARCHRAGTR